MKVRALSICAASLALAAATLSGCKTTGASASTSAPATPPTVAWNDVGEPHLGKTITVCGPVALAMGPNPNGKALGLPPTLGSLVLGGPPVSDPRSIMNEPWRFKVVIQNYHSGFAPNPAEYYKGKNVCVAGPIVLALVGGYEVLPTHPEQIALQGEAVPTLPRGRVQQLPAGAVHYDEAKNYIGQTKTVCGVVLSGWADMVPAKKFPPGYQPPEDILQRLPAAFAMSTDTRTMHELYVGDRVHYTVSILADAAKSLPRPAVEYYLDKEVCFTGKLEPSIMEGAQVLIDDLASVRVLD